MGAVMTAIRKGNRIISDLTVFIPTLGRTQLKACLASLAQGNALPAKIIVVDQGDNPVVADWLRDLEAGGLETLHVVSSQRSAASARNRAIERVATVFAAALDDDCIPAPDWLERMDECLRQNPAALITGRCMPGGSGNAPTIVTSRVPRIHTRPSMRVPSPLASGNMGFAVSTAHQIGPFDENLAEAEDNDWAYRALRAGITVMYAPQVVVDHVHWRDTDQLTDVYRAYARSQGVFFGKHIRRGDWWMALRTGDYLLRTGYMALSGLVTNNRARRMGGWMKFNQFLAGLLAGLRGRGSR
jgi:GT2 family glycosyltransferase